ncbi:MAG: nucleotidyltransferase family protein [Clostridiales bacterium]|nr:nucleotidyltransferase family protein [Clostridiales bacterium]
MEKASVIHCILLAAGFSRRYGGNKLTALIGGREMFRHTADILQKLAGEGLCTLRIVTRPGLLPETGIETVMNPDAEEGIASSVRAGILSLPEDGAPAAFFAADQPYLSEESIRGFLASGLPRGKGIMRCEAGGKPGNPVMFDRKYFPELLALKGDTGGRQVMRAHPGDIAEYHIENAKELTDLDERE